MFAVTECRVAIHCLGDKFLVFRVQVAEVGKLPITTVANQPSAYALVTLAHRPSAYVTKEGKGPKGAPIVREPRACVANKVAKPSAAVQARAVLPLVAL
jgi:hypothetical protein